MKKNVQIRARARAANRPVLTSLAWLAMVLAHGLALAAESGVIQPYQAQTIAPVQAQTIAPVEAQTIAPIQAAPIQVYTSSPAITPATPSQRHQDPRAKQASPWLVKGKELLAAKDYRQAIEAYTKAIEIYPESASAYNNRGLAFQRLKDLPHAKSDYDSALRLNPKDRVAYYNRALVCKKQGNQPQYEADLRASAKLGFPKAQSLLAKLDPSTPQPSSASGTPASANAEASAPNEAEKPLASWVGTWTLQGDWGTFSLTQAGNEVTGKIIGGWAEGKISGKATGNELWAEFQRENRTHVDGQVHLMLGPDGQSFTGNWRFIESIAWAASTLAGKRAANASVPATPVIDAAAVVGTWYGVASTVGTIVCNADGTYVYNGNPGGRYQVTKNGVDFSGNLAAWGGGHATLKKGNLEFYWTNPNGAINWFAFSK